MQDNKGIVYILKDLEEKKSLWVHEFKGGMPRKLTDLGDPYIAMKGLAVAPDGKSFAVVQGGWRHDAVLLKGLR